MTTPRQGAQPPRRFVNCTATKRGSTVSFEQVPTAVHPSATDRPPPAQSAAVPGTVLYIEDNPTTTMLVERILTARPGIVFASAPDGRTGLDRAAHLLPDLILLDLELPDISGEQVLTQLRADPATRTIPIVVITAEIDPAVLHRVLTQGAYWCLTKPFEVTHLLRLVDGFVRSGRP
jgi:CheY-like chemotaxis protein